MVSPGMSNHSGVSSMLPMYDGVILDMTEPSGFHDEVGNLGNEILRKSLTHSGPAVQREAVAFEKLLHPPSTSKQLFIATGLSELKGLPLDTATSDPQVNSSQSINPH